MSNFVPEKTALGIEFGSTRIKAVLIGPEHTPLAQGDYTWENQLHNGICLEAGVIAVVTNRSIIEQVKCASVD